ncbi:MAG TPA: SCO1664 family protein [Acidimicrobiales bacterium]|nr:SCO1664 family protein [Acidimicrobiales bacterium]
MRDQSPFRERGPLATDAALDVLQTSEIIVLGRMPYSSNATFLVDLSSDEQSNDVVAQGIYKPARGERPLWDFPHGLWKREVAAFELSDHLGWHLVPPTVEREGPLGPGSLQLFVPHDMEQHYLTLREDPRHRHAFERLCVFDIVSNNTDRKSGHCLIGTDGNIWAIDNGLSFHAEFKLRTVLWDFAGERIPRDIIADIEFLLDEGVPESVTDALDEDEVDAMLTRTRAIVSSGCFPRDSSGRRWPWPLV